MSVRVVVYTGGKWELVNGNIEYVPFDCMRRGFESPIDISYSSFLSYISEMCVLQNITRLSYRMSAFTDPIDIIDDRDLRLFFKMAQQNPEEMFKLYVIQEFGVGSSSHIPSNPFRTPGLNDLVYETDEFGDGRFSKGYMFKDKEELKLELGKMCLEQCFEYKVDKSSKSRYEASYLVVGCEWRIRAYNYRHSSMFYVAYFNDNHTCSKTQTYPHLRQANPKVLGHYLIDQLKDNGRIYRGSEIVKDISQRFKVNISYSQSWRGKSYALEVLRGTSKNSFSELPIYCHNLEKANPGTVTHIKTDELSRFEMVFVAIGALIRSFLSNLRPLIIIDAAHLKGDFKGTMFLAVGMDGNNQIFPIAYGIGKAEDGESWVWFLSKLKECIGEHPELAIISDRAASIDMAIREVFPQAFHGLCCRHLLMNLHLKSGKEKEHEWLWWKTCKSYRMSNFEESFDALCEAVPRVKNTLLNIGLEKWSRAHCPGKRNHCMTSNSAESINALSKHSRKMPIYQLIEFFREFVQRWFYERRLHGLQTKHLLTEWAEKKIQKKIIGSKLWHVAGIGLNTFEVEDGRKKGFVDLLNHTCSCRVWQVSGFPCGHVISVSRFLKEKDCSHYAFTCYTNEVYKNTYEEAINPLPHRSEWEIPDGLIDLQPPHMTKRQAGRPRENKQILSRGEEPTPLHCSRCKKYGHHRDRCSCPMPSQISSKHNTTISVDPEKFQDYVYHNTCEFPTYDLNEF